MPNAEALREIIPVLRALEQADRFKMSEWASGSVNPNAADWTQCGTQFCLAGAKAAFDGWRPQYEMVEAYNRKTDTYEMVPRATGRFVRPEHQATSHSRHDTGTHEADRIARVAFGLDMEEAQFLFMATHISRVDDLVRRIEWLINGGEPEDFPLAIRDEEKRHAEEDGFDSSDESEQLVGYRDGYDDEDEDGDECDGDCAEDQCPHC